MDALTQIGERRIAEAVATGALDDLPGAGRPLPADDLAGVPDDLRACVLVLRNAGLLPPELELQRELLRLAHLLRACVDDDARARLQHEARAVRLRLALLLDHVRPTSPLLEYQDALVARLARGEGPP
ncbi:MAG: DUF1992 domain-containing protein [Planctomycetota bacterium]